MIHPVRSVRYRASRAWDPRRQQETQGKRVVYHALREDLARYQGGRFLEVGPKHGEDSRLLATLEPSEFVLVDLPEKTEMVNGWLGGVPHARHVEANLLYLDDREIGDLGRFDLVWCLGVLYHNVEQVRLLRRLYELTDDDGLAVVESATTRSRLLERQNVVRVHWPETYRGVQTITHLPSRAAIKSWMEMVGFTDVRIRDVYSRSLRWQRTVLTGRGGGSGYAGYGEYVAGTATTIPPSATL